jgi:DNA (cytosine-5)-methyltransferase 1
MRGISMSLNGRALKALDFFAGSGLVKLGLQPAFDTVWSNDNCAKKAAVFKANFGEAGFALADIQAILGESLPVADLAWASFPCQDLSLAGNLRGIQEGTRSGLFWEWIRVLDELSASKRPPRVVVAENVVGFLVANDGADFRVAYRALRSRGYVAGALAIDSRHFVPQSRPRAFLVAVREGTDLRGLAQSGPSEPFHTSSVRRAASAAADPDWIWWSLPLPTTRVPSLASIVETDVRGAVRDRKHFEESLSPANLEKVRVISQLGHAAVGTAYKRTRPTLDGRKKTRLELRFDGLAGCLRTPKGGSSRQLLVSIEKGQIRTRLLTVRECARLMGAPDSFRIPGSYNDGYGAMGDAVVVPVTKWLSNNLLAELALRPRKRRAA